MKVIIRQYLDQSLEHGLRWQLLLEFLGGVLVMMQPVACVDEQEPGKEGITAHEIVPFHRRNLDFDEAVLFQILHLGLNKLSFNLLGGHL